MKSIASLSLLIIFGIISAMAQINVPCYTNEMMAKRIAENPEIERIHQQVNDIVTAHSENYPASSRGGATVIPVVFHVIHANGPENISKERIELQIEKMNEDFSLSNPDTANIESIFKPVAANAGIEFRLANIDPNGNCTDGIVRVYSELTYDANDNVKPLSRWPNTKYLNIWVVSYIELEGDDPDFVVGGYAYYPSVVNWGPEIDGIVIRADQVGATFNSRTLTHEVGHYLNLAHTFDGGCFGGDNVSDTPPTAEPNYGCPLNLNSCNNDNPNIKDNVQNYMDYSDCGVMFTQGQVSRMLSAISNYRLQLVSSGNLAATGVNNNPPDLCKPTADFLASNYQVCAGNTVTFTDQSWNGQPTQWSWTFDGGSPQSATTENPTITYNTPGIYDVTLVASNSSGSDTETKTAHVQVYGNALLTNAPYAEGFEDVSFFNNNWEIEGSQGGQQWSRYSGAAYTGSSCVRINNFNSSVGEIDNLISPSYDMSVAPNTTMKFKYAYVQRDEDSSDKLRVLFSTNCGATWILRWSKTGSTLATGNPQSSPFIPSSTSQWEAVSINLPSSIYESDNVRMRFEFTSGRGNMLYIDDINLGGTVGIEDITAETIRLTLSPNPTENSSVLSFELMESERIALYATDMMGKRMQITGAQQLAPGQHRIEIHKELLGAAGIYMLTLEGENMRIVEKLVVY